MSDVGGFGEVAERGAGRLVPPGDPEALAARRWRAARRSAARERLVGGRRRPRRGPVLLGRRRRRRPSPSTAS